jgi:uncharacterized protein (DUF2252 family)
MDDLSVCDDSNGHDHLEIVPFDAAAMVDDGPPPTAVADTTSELTDGASAEADPWSSLAERRSQGRARRQLVARSSHSAWEFTADRPDPVEVLIDSNRTRLVDLVPLRNRRMLASPFAYFRGSALMMTLDLARSPSTNLSVQLCGDAHLMNFGVFASPEHSLLFDLNDFDETWPGPFEWDVKRLAASVVLACRANGMAPSQARSAAVASAAAYRHWIERYSEMNPLDVWYAKLDARELLDLMQPSDRRLAKRTLDKALERNHLKALAKLTEVVDGHPRITADPPLVVRHEGDPAIMRQMPSMLREYANSLSTERRVLFERYRLVDVARKVVGVGSVGRRCWLLLLEGPNHDPLFLQAKEAGVAAPEAAGLPGPSLHHGQRVVTGQRMLQAAGDVLLGWTTAGETNTPYYVRQLWDAKGSADVAGMSPTALRTYSSACGWALARAHARTSDSAAIAGYLGRTPRFDEAIGDFAEAYADQCERDHATLLAASDDGRIPVSPSA